MERRTFTFSVSEHTRHLAGYMDAVGRVVTTDSELYSLDAQTVSRDVQIERILRVPIRSCSLVSNWSKEFSALAAQFLGLDEHSRLAFYLIDMICWFEDFTTSATCFKIECDSFGSKGIDQAVYVIEIAKRERVLLRAMRSTKVYGQELDTALSDE